MPFSLFYASDSPFEPPSILGLLLRTPLRFAVYVTYHFLTSLRTTPAPLAAPPVRVVCVSDTHNLKQNIPDGDVLIHAGDLTNGGSLSELQAQIDWLNSLPHQHKVAIAGNHDTYLDPRSRRTLAEEDRNGKLDWRDIHYLQHSSVTLRVPNTKAGSNGHASTHSRRLKIYGAPQIPECGGPEHAFQYQRGRDAFTDTVPRDVDILVTHTPPKWHRDLPLRSGLGCEFLNREVRRVRPALHVFGHVHVEAGKEVAWWDESQRAYEKAMARPVRGSIRGLFDVGMWFQLVLVAFWGVRNVLWDRVWCGEEKGTIMVNAGLMKGNTGRLGNKVRVVDI
ncbi:Metallo-dependent phosphatase-like protein [Phyllosticta citrichinensis]|uniref:Metallo-dependent phosphatase-like protein n=1 Tax=Phyllosticta citrichinensis TaxID=1130410 RepID=A0ABR1XMK2_9PEZI